MQLLKVTFDLLDVKHAGTLDDVAFNRLLSTVTGGSCLTWT